MGVTASTPKRCLKLEPPQALEGARGTGGAIGADAFSHQWYLWLGEGAEKARTPAMGGKQTLPSGTSTALKDPMQEQSFYIAARDKPGLLAAMMRHLAGDAYISFEGDLHRIDWEGVIAVDESQSSLRRATLTPELDFVILPLTVETQPLIWAAVSKGDHLADDGIIHTQIEQGGRLAFGAYDNFHADCVSGPAVPRSLLERLKESGVIRSFEAAVD